MRTALLAALLTAGLLPAAAARGAEGQSLAGQIGLPGWELLAAAGDAEPIRLPELCEVPRSAPQKSITVRDPAGPTQMLSFAWRPLVFVERSDLDDDLEPRSAGGFELSLFADVEEPVMIGGALAVELYEQEDSDRDVELYRLDAGAGAAVTRSLFRAEVLVGSGLMFLDFERQKYDTYAVGMFARGGLSLGPWARWSVGIHADLHGWLGMDEEGFQSAWGAAFGAQISFWF